MNIFPFPQGADAMGILNKQFRLKLRIKWKAVQGCIKRLFPKENLLQTFISILLNLPLEGSSLLLLDSKDQWRGAYLKCYYLTNGVRRKCFQDLYNIYSHICYLCHGHELSYNIMRS